MSSFKTWNGSTWVENPLKTWNGSSWVEYPLKYWTGGAWATVGAASGASINALDYAHGDGTTDDTAHLTTAANLAIAESKTLYFPAATYKVTNWVPPANLTMIGDGGELSHIKGMVKWRGGQNYQKLFIGDKTTSAIGPYYASGSITHEGTTYTDCKFRGGGTNNATLVHPAQGYGSQSIITRDFIFHGCEWECNYQTAYSQAAQDVSWFVDRGTGDISENIVFEGCHFGTTNEQSRTGGIFGGIVFWSSCPVGGGPSNAGETYNLYPNMANGYYDDIYFSACIFERADIWNLDMSGAQYAPSNFTENTVFITDCVFKGLSGAYHSEYTTRVGSQCEPSWDAVIARNIFGIADSNAWKFIKGSARCSLTDNTFDYRTFANTVDHQNGLAMIDTIYGINQVIRLGDEERNITITNNHLLLPNEKYKSLSQQGWIKDDSSRATKSGNTVAWASGSGPLAAY
jgi:hypothetical protein